MNALNNHIVLILALVCINQPVYAQVSNGEGFEPLEGVPSPDEAAISRTTNLSESVTKSLKDASAAYFLGNSTVALKLWLPLAIQGNADGQAGLGRMYRTGSGVTKDYQEALKWFRLAVAQGNANGQAGLGDMYRHGFGVTKDYQEALKWFRLAAEQGNVRGQASMGNMYRHGFGVTKDYQEALKWYRLAADQGDAYGKAAMGNMYQNGFGVTKDYQEALKWFRLAADQGNAGGQVALGHMYQNGFGVTKDYQETLKWYRLAADQGDSWAQSNLGWMYANGQGVTKDDKEAARWYRLAAEQGDVGAQAYLKTNIAGSYSATDMPELAKKSGCTACHRIDTKLVGPAWMDVSKQYKGATEYSYSPRGSAAADAERMSLVDGLAMKIAKGGTGNWGRAAMIANSPKVSDPDIRTLVNFILGLAK